VTVAKIIKLRSVQRDRVATCSCGAKIRWACTERGANMALEHYAEVTPAEGGGLQVSSDHVHFARCPHSRVHRRERTTHPSERID